MVSLDDIKTQFPKFDYSRIDDLFIQGLLDDANNFVESRRSQGGFSESSEYYAKQYVLYQVASHLSLQNINQKEYSQVLLSRSDKYESLLMESLAKISGEPSLGNFFVSETE